MSKLAFILGGAPENGPASAGFRDEDRKERKRALARSLKRAMREEGADDDALVTAIEDAFMGFREED